MARTAIRTAPLPANRQSGAVRQFQQFQQVEQVQNESSEPASLRSRSLDRILTSLTIVLVGFTPFALGAVHPWPAALMEIGVAGLVIIWAIRTAAAARIFGAVWWPKSLRFVSPILLFTAFLLFQLIPLPPRVMRIISPATYQFYVKALPEWPRTAPYLDQAYFAPSPPPAPRSGSTMSPISTVLPTIQEVQQGVPIPFAKQAALPVNGTNQTSETNEISEASEKSERSEKNFGARRSGVSAGAAARNQRRAFFRFGIRL